MSRYHPDRLRRLRDLPLHTVAAAVGYRRDPRDRTRWKKNGSVLGIDGTRFYDHLLQQGGGGAIDLVMHANRCQFSRAVAFLERIAPPGTVDPADGDKWVAVRKYLQDHRSIDEDLVDRCRQEGIVAADRRGNAVFVMRGPSGGTVGAELVGFDSRSGNTVFRGLARGSSRKRGAFRIPCPTRPDNREPVGGTVLIVESAIDALSAWLLPLSRKPDCILSTAGATSVLPPWLAHPRVRTILCGYDADPTGDRCADSLQTDPRVIRMRPEGNNIKDWNDLLRATVF
ncbi:MAG: DUF3991 domain-containing protein [Gammaproteobacteria bacterium]|nr:DUF3991 domain-containing protein [Gammaproteobacteria bacterium]